MREREGTDEEERMQRERERVPEKLRQLRG